MDVDLVKFFDRINNDILLDRIRKRIDATGVIRLTQVYLNAGIMDGREVMDLHLDTPQSGLLTPLLTNVMLDKVDKTQGNPPIFGLSQK